MIKEILLEGAENAQTGRRICDLLNINQRDLTQAIARERRAGAPICASCGDNPGYYLAGSKQEMRVYCRSLRKRAREVNETAKACEKTIGSLN